MKLDINGMVCGAVELEFPNMLTIRFDPPTPGGQWQRCRLYVRDATWRITMPSGETIERDDLDALAGAKTCLVGRSVASMRHEPKLDGLVVTFSGKHVLEIEAYDDLGEGRIGTPSVARTPLPTWPYSFVLDAR